MTSIFQMNPVIVLGHSLTDPHVRHVLEAAKKGSGVVQPVCWFAPNVPHGMAREYLEKYRIRVITYDNRDGKHTNLARLVETISDFVPPRLSIQISKTIAEASKSPLGTNAAAPGFFVFTKLSPYTDIETKRVEIMVAALRAGLDALSSRAAFSIQEALAVVGWPTSLAIESDLAASVAAQAISEKLLAPSNGLFTVASEGLTRVREEQNQFVHLRTRFQNSLQNRLKRLFPALDLSQVPGIAADIDSALVGYFRDGGLTLASTLLATQSSVSQVLPSSVLKFINQAAAKYDDHLRRQAFSTACIDAFIRPSTADREYLGRVSQGFFAFHLLGVFGDAAAERVKHVKDTVWLIDSSIQIAAIAVSCPSYAIFREAFSRLKALGVRVFSTEGLFDETREHLWFANKIIRDHGSKSPDVMAAARGDLPYRKANLFLEGFVNWQAAGNPADWEQYLTEVTGQPSPTVEDVRFAVEALSIEIVSFPDWPGFGTEHYSETEEITTDVVKTYDPAIISSSDADDLYKKAKPEAEAFVIVREERDGDFYMLSEEGDRSPAWFISSTSTLNKVYAGQRITWQPEAFLRFLATLAPATDQAAADRAFETLVWSLAQSGLNVLDDRVITTVFGGIIDQAKLTVKEQHAAYEHVLSDKYSEPIDSVLDHVPAPQQPLAALQLANERAERESEFRRVAQATAESATKKADTLAAELKEVGQFKQKLQKKRRQAEQRKRRSQSGKKRKKNKR